MKIAILGDIHGNIEALKAVYGAVQFVNVEKIYHLGDVGGYAPFVNEVVDFLIERGIEGVQGNYDFNVAHDSEHCGCKYEEPLQAELADLSFAWTKRHASAVSKTYMRNLPGLISLPVQGRRISLFHATPHKNNLYWYEDRPERFFLEMAGKTDGDIMVYGHTHKPYRRDIGERIFINAGSVGKSKDGDPRACVAVIDIEETGVRSEFLRVPYDVEAVAAAIRASGLPLYFADKLKNGQ